MRKYFSVFQLPIFIQFNNFIWFCRRLFAFVSAFSQPPLRQQFVWFVGAIGVPAGSPGKLGDTSGDAYWPKEPLLTLSMATRVNRNLAADLLIDGISTRAPSRPQPPPPAFSALSSPFTRFTGQGKSEPEKTRRRGRKLSHKAPNSICRRAWACKKQCEQKAKCRTTTLDMWTGGKMRAAKGNPKLVAKKRYPGIYQLLN